MAMDKYLDDFDFAEKILLKVSRTFALNINVLSGKLHRSTLLAYLYLRIVDTIEDDPEMSALQKENIFDRFANIFESEKIDSEKIKIFQEMLPAVWETSTDPNHILCLHSERVISLLEQMPLQYWSPIKRVVVEMCGGMAKFALRQKEQLASGWFILDSIQDLDEYCYYVAGIVGQMLTQLFHADSRYIHQAIFEKMQKLDVSFGLGLQVTNIIKDIVEDSQRKVCFIPQEICHRYGFQNSFDIFASDAHKDARAAIVQELIEKAWNHLEDAVRYVLLIPRRNRRIRLFCLWPLLMAAENLRLIGNGKVIFESDKKAKISRKTVKRIVRATMLHFYSNSWIKKEFARLRSSNNNLG